MRPAVIAFLAPLVVGCQTPIDYAECYPNGQQKAQGKLVGDKHEGPWTYYWDNGRIKDQGRYEDNHRVGRWTSWYENGNKEMEGAIRHEHRVGVWSYWRPNGQLYGQGWCDLGRKNGQWTFFDEQGRREQRGEYADSKRTLRWEYWHANGQRSAEGFYHDDIKIGVWNYWDAAGKPSQRSHPMPDGVALVVEHWPNGQPQRAGFHVNELPSGRWVTWHDTGAQRLSGDRDGAATVGIWRAWHADGSLLGTGTTAHGRPHGEWDIMQAGILVKTPVDDRPPTVWNGVWSSATEYDARPPLVAVELWLQEMGSPQQTSTGKTIPADASTPTAEKPKPPEPDASLEQRSSIKKREPARAQPLTVSEEKHMPKWRRAYGKGARTRTFDMYDLDDGSGRERQSDRGDAAMSARLTGTTLPLTRFKTADGKSIDLRRGNEKLWTLLVILRGYAGEICPYCPAQMGALIEYLPAIAKLGTEAVAMYPGEESGLDTLLRDFKNTYGEDETALYRFLYDADNRLAEKLGILDDRLRPSNYARPTTLLVDGNAVVLYAYVGRHKADRPAAARLIEKIRELRAK